MGGIGANGQNKLNAILLIAVGAYRISASGLFDVMAAVGGGAMPDAADFNPDHV